MDIITRKDALAQGLPRYFTGKPCKKGHVAERRTKERVCLACMSESHADWYARNRETKIAKNKAHAAANPHQGRERTRRWRKGNPEKAAAAFKKWEDQNREERSSYRRERYAADPEPVRRKNRDWAASNPEAISARDARRRSLLLAADGTHTPADLRRILRAQGYLCPYCLANLRKVKKHLDHVMPLALGGSNGPENLQYLCAPCNLSKGAKDPIDFARERGLLV